LHSEGWVSFVVPQWFSLSLIVTIFVLALLYARRPRSAH
jgi:hypothetical protein